MYESLLNLFPFGIKISSDLVFKRKAIKKEIFNTIVLPVMSDFDRVHQDYLDSYSKYINLLEKKSALVLINDHNIILDNIYKDSLFSQGLRMKIYSFCDNNKKSELDSYILSLLKYFSRIGIEHKFLNNEMTKYYKITTANTPRLYLSHFIYIYLDLNDSLDVVRSNIQKTIFEYIDILQKNYINVLDEFNFLRDNSV